MLYYTNTAFIKVSSNFNYFKFVVIIGGKSVLSMRNATVVFDMEPLPIRTINYFFIYFNGRTIFLS